MDGVVSIFLGVTLLTGLALLVFHVTVHPVWGLIDCAISKDQSSAAKVIWIIVMIATWGFGSLLYGLFGTKSIFAKATRRTFGGLIGAVIVLLVAMRFIPDVENRFPARIQEKISAGRADPMTQRDIVTIAANTLDLAPFSAVHYVPTSTTQFSVSIAQFNSEGLIGDQLLPIVVPSIYPVNHLAVDPKGPVYYAITTHEVGKIIPSTGKFVPLEVDPALPELSWPSGVAFDSKDRMLIVTGRSNSYSFNPETGEWKLIPAMADLSLCGLAYNPESGSIFGLVDSFGSDHVSQLVELNKSGAVLRSIDLSQSVPIGRVTERGVQLIHSSGKLVILLSARVKPGDSGGVVSTPARMYMVNPTNGDLVLVSGSG